MRWNLAVAMLVIAPLVSTSSLCAQAVGPSDSMGSVAMDRAIRTYLLADQLELKPNVIGRPAALRFTGWTGGDYRRLYVRAQGEMPTENTSDADLQADVLFGRLLTPFWSAVAGVRIETRPRAVGSALPSNGGAAADGNSASRSDRVTRGMLAVGMLGLAPYWFEMEPTLFVSDKGDVSLEFESTIDLLFTQRLILQPRLEFNAAVQAVPEFGIASGLNDVEVGARLRYEVHRKFAPYVGVSWFRRTGGTAAMAKAAGAPKGEGSVAAGVRIWR